MPLEIVWSRLARARLEEIRAYVALDKSVAAQRLAIRIVAVAEALRLHPYLGRTSTETDLRELVVGGTPYAIVYRLRGNRVVIVTISHAAQRQ